MVPLSFRAIKLQPAKTAAFILNVVNPIFQANSQSHWECLVDFSDILTINMNGMNVLSKGKSGREGPGY